MLSVKQLAKRLWKKTLAAKSEANPRRDFSLGFEQLEPRNMLAGDVMVEVVGGNLIIEGDEFDNEIRIDQSGLAAGVFRVSSGSDD